MKMKRTESVAFLLLTAALVSGCDDFRAATGQGKDAPDEFAVVTKAPLIIPPDYNLHPPKPGEAPLNQVEPTEAAEQSLFGSDAGAKPAPSDMSGGEKQLLANAGAESSDPTIRQDLATDFNREEQAASDDFTNQVLFWQTPTTTDEGLNPDAALKELPVQSAQTTSAPVSPATSAATQVPADPHDTSSATIDKDNKKSGNSGGWFNWF